MAPGRPQGLLLAALVEVIGAYGQQRVGAAQPPQALLELGQHPPMGRIDPAHAADDPHALVFVLEGAVDHTQGDFHHLPGLKRPLAVVPPVVVHEPHLPLVDILPAPGPDGRHGLFRPFGVDKVGGHPEAELVVFQPRPQVGHRDFYQVISCPVELGQVRTPRYVTEEVQARIPEAGLPSFTPLAGSAEDTASCLAGRAHRTLTHCVSRHNILPPPATAGPGLSAPRGQPWSARRPQTQYSAPRRDGAFLLRRRHPQFSHLADPPTRYRRLTKVTQPATCGRRPGPTRRCPTGPAGSAGRGTRRTGVPGLQQAKTGVTMTSSRTPPSALLC